MHPSTFRDPFSRTSAEPLRSVAIIPARYQSTRFPGKPLADLAGRPMIEHVYRRTASASGIDAVIVATDDPRIADVVRGFGGVVALTSTAHRTGTDRIAEVAGALTCEIVVNVQGDEPLIDPGMVTEVLTPFATDPTLRMSTLKRRVTDEADLADPGVVKVVTDRFGHALYFSRAPIPASFTGDAPVAWRHVGLYAYRRTFLLELTAWPQTPLERAESLEQLRALEHGVPILTLETAYDSIGVDTPEDLERVRRRLAAAPAQPTSGRSDNAALHTR